MKGKWVDSNFQIIDLLVQPRAAGVAETLIFVHIANFATLQPWLHVGYFTCRILIHCIRTRDPAMWVHVVFGVSQSTVLGPHTIFYYTLMTFHQ